MKRLLLYSLLTVMTTSCSLDKEHTLAMQSDISGSWDAVEFRIDEDNASTEERNARDMLALLTARGCTVISFHFKDDLSVISENSINYLEVSVSPEGNGIDIPCPETKDVETGEYTFDGETLVYIGPDGIAGEIKALKSGSTLIINAADLDIPNFSTTANGQLVFQKR